MSRLVSAPLALSGYIQDAGTEVELLGVNPFHLMARLLTVIFVIGVAGCAIVIPMAAWKFLSVLFEKDVDEETPRVQLD